jgi:hypothetical protein
MGPLSLRLATYPIANPIWRVLIKEAKSVMTTSTYPVKVNAQMDVRLNRSLWLVKWLLAIPELQELTVARRSPFWRQLCTPNVATAPVSR